MRGKASGVHSDPTSPRITPAYAGKRGAEMDEINWKEDHPRLCGEKYTP